MTYHTSMNKKKQEIESSKIIYVRPAEGPIKHIEIFRLENRDLKAPDQNLRFSFGRPNIFLILMDSPKTSAAKYD